LAAARRAFSRTGKEGAIARVLSFDGELSQEQRARLADIAERTPVTLTLKNGIAITTTVA
jgi:putative redox protein